MQRQKAPGWRKVKAEDEQMRWWTTWFVLFLSPAASVAVCEFQLFHLTKACPCRVPTPCWETCQSIWIWVCPFSSSIPRTSPEVWEGSGLPRPREHHTSQPQCNQCPHECAVELRDGTGNRSGLVHRFK